MANVQSDTPGVPEGYVLEEGPWMKYQPDLSKLTDADLIAAYKSKGGNAFDPDKYLASKGGFDPDAYLRSKGDEPGPWTKYGAALPAGFEQPSLGADVAKSIGSGLGSATISTLGSLGDLRGYMSRGVDALGAELGISPSTVAAVKNAAGYLAPLTAHAPTSDQLRATVTDPIVSPDYKPQTLAGNFAKTGAEFTPGLLMGGPEGLGARLATNVALPAIGSETAGQITKGTAAEPYARVLGAFVGGAGATKALNAASEAGIRNAITPSLEDLKTTTGANYDAIRDANVGRPLPANALDQTADEVVKALNAKGQRPINAGELHGVVDAMRTPATEGAPDVADLLAARAAIKDVGGNPAGAKIALGKVEDAIDKYSPGTMDQLRAQDQNWSAFRTGEALDKNIARAEDSANGANSGLNLGNRILQRATALKNSKQWDYMNAAQKAEVQKVIDMTSTQKGLRSLANLAGKGHGLGLPVFSEFISDVLGLHPGVGAAIGLVGGRGLNALYNRSVSNAANAASDAIRRASPMGQQMAERLYVSPNPSAVGSGVRAGRIERSRRALPAGILGAAIAHQNQREALP